jgi:uncharacterized cupredoxin-like copper-binding protein
MRGVLALLVGTGTAFGGYAMSAGAHTRVVPPLGPGLVTVDVGIHYSRFSISTLHVRKGTLVRFLVRNTDPIHHEFIVGDSSVHRRHERGHESAHPPVPGEVSIAPNDIGETFYRFDHVGSFLFACHLPGHFAYGMRGTVVVAP